jgi:CheY-like chemotaxis protein
MNTSPVLGNRRILVIDDNPSIHDDYRKILAPAETDDRLEEVEAAIFGERAQVTRVSRYELTSAFQGEEGVSKVRQALSEGRPYAMAFVDVRMPPGIDGVETVAKIWEVDADVQVVICTAYSDYSWDAMYERIGNSDRLLILKKPFDNIEVLQMADALVEKWQLLQQARRNMAEGVVIERDKVIFPEGNGIGAVLEA